MTQPDGTGDGAGDEAATREDVRQRGSDRKSMLLRLDPQVHAALSRWAADELRSTNAHIEWLLRRAVLEAGRLPRAGRAAVGTETGDEGDETPVSPA